MPLNPQLIATIKLNFANLSSEELQGILTKRDESQWSDEAFEAARQLLEERDTGTAREPATLLPTDDLWQDGECVVLRDRAVFPPRCVLCNEPQTSAVPLLPDAGSSHLQCCLCPHHTRRSLLSRQAYRCGHAIGLWAIISLYFSLDGLGDWKFKAAVSIGLLGLWIAVYVSWLGTKAVLYSNAWGLAKFEIMRLFSLMLMLGAGLIAAAGWVVVEGWNQGFYLFVVLTLVPPVASVLLLFWFKLGLAVLPSATGFLVLSGTGTRFRASLPHWPGVPKDAPATSPSDIGKRTYA